MTLLIAVLAFLSAAFLLFRYTRRHDPLLSDDTNYTQEPHGRPLFEPTEDELRHDAKMEQARLIAKREYLAKADAREMVDKAVADWRSARDRKSAAELLRVTAESGLDGDFSKAAGEIIEQFHGPGIDGLTNEDLAALLDSHIGLLSMSERGTGSIFWLKQEVARLRAAIDVDQR
jgi:hypothetical protein